jgi:hypothetical protein
VLVAHDNRGESHAAWIEEQLHEQAETYGEPHRRQCAFAGRVGERRRAHRLGHGEQGDRRRQARLGEEAWWQEEPLDVEWRPQAERGEEEQQRSFDNEAFGRNEAFERYEAQLRQARDVVARSQEHGSQWRFDQVAQRAWREPFVVDVASRSFGVARRQAWWSLGIARHEAERTFGVARGSP